MAGLSLSRTKLDNKDRKTNKINPSKILSFTTGLTKARETLQRIWEIIVTTVMYLVIGML